ncbi:AAWKG family protein [Streptomyces sp. NPDC057430]|uniref:AAWKG family protein n=1 Tax=Streptomyces sp. NPDC057430 TaxID=3346131 RepID=UPI0036B56615
MAEAPKNGNVSTQPDWEAVIKQFTGFDGGTRAQVAAIGGADTKQGDGSEWMRIKIDIGDNYRATTPSIEDGPVDGRVIKLYAGGEKLGASVAVYTVTLSVPWSGPDGSHWNNNGVAGAFDWGYREAIDHLLTKYTTDGFGGGYDPPRVVAFADAPDLRTLPPIAMAFDRVSQFFRDHSPKLERWVKDLGGEDAAYRGSGADVFRDLIGGTSAGYKDFLSLFALPAPRSGKSSKIDPDYRADSVVSERVMEAEETFLSTAKRLKEIHEGWIASNLWLGTALLDKHVDTAATWLNENNIAKMRQSGPGVSQVGEGFSTKHPVYGDLSQESGWKGVSKQACAEWIAAIKTHLDAPAGSVVIDFNSKMRAFERRTPLAFKAGITSLKDANAADKAKADADKAKADAEKEKADAQKELDKYKKGGGDNPPLGPNPTGGGLGDGRGGPGLGDGRGGPGLGDGKGGPGLGDGKGGPPPFTVPPLGPNPIGGNGSGGPTGAGPGSVVRNPDGSTTVTTPDGQRTTYPPGVIPPPLPPNGIGGGLTPGGSPTVVKTTKGPDGSTTSYNSDGSRTTTHKDGTTTTVRPDGTTETSNPDGSKTVLNNDGSQTTTYQDGTRTTVKPDGTTTTRYTDGTVTVHAPDGTLTTTDAEGRSTTSHPQPGQTVRNPDGSSTVYGDDGASTTTYPNGTKTIVTANGTVTTLDPDGTKTVSHLGKGVSTVQYADGSVAQVERDGTVSTTYKDGSTTKLGPDGTYTTVDANGHRTTEHLNVTGGAGGPQTTHHADGSTTTKYPDGTVDKRLKDGGHQITYPDGRTVTTDAYGRTTGGSGLLPPNKSGSTAPDHSYYDFPDRKKGNESLLGGNHGGAGGTGGAGGRLPPLPLNQVGGPGLTAGGTGSAGVAAGSERRALAMTEVSAARSRGVPAEAAVPMRQPNTMSSGTPMMPFMGGGMGGMGGMGGGMGGNTQSDERERSTWVSEDEETWGTDGAGVSGAIGR